ncbi:amino acid transporter AVT1I isoform X2 [Vitis vinifera]|uniref:amino acid transporter AVT1I isoform X2 n=1 Tax=Vitis vinifera TaxID=29760 RepID=UPI0008FEE4A7|nr:amino acid transporter AVT1I isoform X2 [Vitis vinifera]|eukprot:XP_019072519.1 PREDICTED: vacuolar amino acid transporter 1 isoform X3 [Vitis vinifera]
MANNELRIPLIRTPGSSSFMKASFNGTNAFLEMYLIATGFLILEGDNLQKLFPEFMIKLGELTLDGKQSFVIITGLLFSALMLLTDLSMLSYISATGVFSCLVIVVSIFCVGAFDGVGFHAKGSVLLNLDTLPTAVGLYIVSFGGHPVIPSIYMSMRDSCQFSKVLVFSFILATLNYMTIAILGYLMYGDGIESEITLNLPTKVSGRVAIYTTLLIPVTRYSLLVAPIATAIEGGLSEKYKNQKPVRLLIRVALLISTVIVACVFPYYESLMAIVGSVFVVSASFLLPCLCYLKISDLNWNWNCEQMGIVGIIVFGILAGVLGTYSSIFELLT